MRSNFKIKTKILLVLTICFCNLISTSQGDTKTVKGHFALGINSPSSNGFVNDFEANPINFPSINLGIQYMFKRRLGAKLDLGYNRFSNAKNTPEFKTNYTRFNLQLVYDTSRFFSFMNRMGVFLHAGPGITMVKPLGNYGENKTSYLNTIGGIELHYGVSDKLSFYLDTAYTFGFGKAFDPISSGFGSFNANLLTITIGASISLSGCYYCND
jgi:OOP family OmpA-OmpF porin